MRLRLFAAGLLTFAALVASASTSMAGFMWDARGWIAVTYDDGELYSLAGSGYLVCEGPGWAAGAQNNPAEGGPRGIVCGAGSRERAEEAALEYCPGRCQVMWSGYDDDETVRNIDNGHTALKNRIFYD